MFLISNWHPLFSNQLIPILSIIEKPSNFHNQIIRIIIYYNIINYIILYINTIIGILTLPDRMILSDLFIKILVKKRQITQSVLFTEH